MNLNDIALPIRAHLDVFDDVFARSIRSNIALVDLVARYLIRRKGKRVRPILVLLGAELCGGVNEKSYRGAGLVEILHTATLVHDDVIDNADTRRGVASVNAVFRNKIAVLMGDYLLARGLLLSLEHDDTAFLKVTSRAVRRMSEGELNQIRRSRKLDMDEEAYFRVIGDKTASLLSTCCEIGAISASTDTRRHELLRDYGEKVGLAFQIRDDLLDYTGRKSITGKPAAQDVREKKLTLPLIHALKTAPASQSRAILSMIKRGGKQLDVGHVVGFVAAMGGLDYAAGRARDYADQAKQLLSGFPPSPAKNSLDAFADFVVQREK